MVLLRTASNGRTMGRLALLAGVSLVLAGCASGLGGSSSAPAPAATPVANAEPDSRGVITYATYQVAVARSGDTMASVASRVGTTPAELATRNALPENHLLREGEVLLLPASVPRPVDAFGTETVTAAPLAWSPESASAAIDAAGTKPRTAAPAAAPTAAAQADPLIDPVRHRVEAGETAYSISRLYGVSVTALASWNGLGPDLMVRENQELLIPIVSGANRISSAPETAATTNQPGQTTPITPPPSASEPLPQDIATATEPESPNLGQYRTPPGGRLSPPVSASVTRKYNPAKPNGIGYSVPAGTPVKAAANGEVALISDELGGIGTIVLIRHPDSLMTTYSTLSNVTVKKGDTVSAGQTIGTVAPRDKPELQFDVFRGTDSVDPTPYVGG